MTGGEWAAWVGVALTALGGVLTWALMVERRIRANERMLAQVATSLQRLPTVERRLTHHIENRELHPNGELKEAYQEAVTERIDGLEGTLNARIDGVAGHVRGVDGRVAQLTTEVHGLSGKIMDVLGMIGNRKGDGA